MRLEPAIDFQTATAAALSGLDDKAVLHAAAQDNRILVSHDLRTMPHHFARFIESEESPGLLIVSQKLSVSQVAEELLLIWLASEPQDWLNQVRTLPL